MQPTSLPHHFRCDLSRESRSPRSCRPAPRRSARDSGAYHEYGAARGARHLLRDAAQRQQVELRLASCTGHDQFRADGFCLAHDGGDRRPIEHLARGVDVQAGNALGQLVGRGLVDSGWRRDRRRPELEQIDGFHVQEAQRVDNLERRPTSACFGSRSGDGVERWVRQVGRREHRTARTERTRYEHAATRITKHPLGDAPERAREARLSVTIGLRYR